VGCRGWSQEAERGGRGVKWLGEWLGFWLLGLSWQAVPINQCSGPKVDAIRARRPLSDSGYRASKRNLRAAAERPKALQEAGIGESAGNL